MTARSQAEKTSLSYLTNGTRQVHETVAMITPKIIISVE